MNRNQVLLTRAKAGDRCAVEELVEENMGLVWSVVKRFLPFGYEAEDLAQLGAMGLVRAIRRFDMSYGVQFSTYAVPMILGEIRRFLRDDGMLKVSRSVRENAIRAARAAETLRNRLGREPLLSEIASESGLSEEVLVEALEASAPVDSIDRPQVWQDGMGKSREPGGENPEETLLERIYLEELLSRLAPREQKILKMRYYEGKTQQEIAERIGVSQVQISRLEKESLRFLRTLQEK